MKNNETKEPAPTDIILNDVEVKEAEIVRSKKGTVTMKTLKAWMEQTQRIIMDRELLNDERGHELLRLMQTVRERFISKNL